jgi:GNAT superfamily N-acetyltransferase
MSDWSKNKEAQEIPRESPPEKLSPRGVSSMRGSDAATESRESLPDRSYTDAQGRDLTMRTYHSGDSYMVRVFDKAKTPQPPDTPSFGDAGRANVHLERNPEGRVDRARLQDIDTTPSYRGAGTGGRMLEQCEDIARQNGAREIYGNFSAEDGKAAETGQFHERRGYRFGGGQQISKAL